MEMIKNIEKQVIYVVEREIDMFTDLKYVMKSYLRSLLVVIGKKIELKNTGIRKGTQD